MIQSKLFLIISAVAILATLLTLATFTIPSFAQSEGGASQDAGHAAQDAGQSAGQAGEATQGNASEAGANVTEDLPVRVSLTRIKNNIPIKKIIQFAFSGFGIFFIGFRFMWNPYVIILYI